VVAIRGALVTTSSVGGTSDRKGRGFCTWTAAGASVVLPQEPQNPGTSRNFLHRMQ
jgi:hypothetical protein